MMAGMMVAGAVTLYSHDVMAMPQICAALITGGAVGLLLGRGVPRSALPALLTGLVGQAGLAAVFIGLAAWRNPHVFGVLDDVTDRPLVGAMVAIGATVTFGAMACAGAATTLRRGGRQRKRKGRFAAAMLLATGGTLGAFVANPATGLLLACVGIALLAGRGLAQRALDYGMGPAVALIGGLAGWAIAGTAFLMGNMAMAVAGGFAGSAGSMFAIRLCGGAGRKGLADVERRP